MSKHENVAMNLKQVATSERSAAARVDPDTERALYRHYRAYFEDAESHRTWNLWNVLDASVSPAEPPARALVEAVFAAYRHELFLPDYAARTLSILRSSRGRAWFWTRWSYEEGKHLLALSEWLLRREVTTDSALRALSDELLETETWLPPDGDGSVVLADALLYEFAEIERAQAILSLAEATGENALVAVMRRIVADETAHRDFLAEALRILSRGNPEPTARALQTLAASHERPQLADALSEYLELP
jgi:acyl-[acyl-carrier-protein] desaturase